MNALTRERFLQVAEFEASSPDLIALLGRDIRSAQEVIAEYCVTEHLPVYEDLAVLVESMAYIDRVVTRHRSKSWCRDLSIRLPVYEQDTFRRSEVLQALTDAAWFLTGDKWHFEFVKRIASARVRQSPLPFSKFATSHVIPFSDGLDSFAQVRFSIAQYGKDAVLLVRAGLSKDRAFPDLLSLRVPRRFAGIRMREVSYRTRPLIFYTFAAIAARVTEAPVVAIGENGQGSFGPACLPFADEWWFRSSHPGFVRRWADALNMILGSRIRFEQPNLWKTKGEVLIDLRERGLADDWHSTSSCSTRPVDRFGHKACGVCGGCLLRIVSALSAGLPVPPDQFAFDIRELMDHGEDSQLAMPAGHGHVAVRAIAAMEGFARLPDSPQGLSTLRREARWVDEDDPAKVEESLFRLLKRHRSEWDSFVSSIPTASWLRKVVAQL